MAKVELKMELPSDIQERKRLKGVVQEAVDIMLQISSLKEQLKDVYVVEKEDHQYSPKFLKSLVSIEYAEQYDSKKKREAIEAAQETLASLDVLMGRSE
jgi:hypothetical protein